ncbi:MAG TPA: Spy/CpxP family protein refolding chaperone [Pyrinomonadaceae bacterium]|nr:Spy/CpxP family protein refolding chaperone [Pyrinomonadaceae bacterium]
MKLAPNTLFKFVIVAALLLTVAGSMNAQTEPQQQAAGDTAQTQMNQADQMLGPLNLSSDQIQRIKSINAELKDERQAANMRLRMAQRELREAIQSPTPDETLISQRSKEVADAQANTIRLRSLTESRILQVLTPEQRVKLRELRQQAMTRRGGNQQQFPRALQRRQNAGQRNQNPNALTPQEQRRLMRQQQQQKRP